MKLTLAFLSLVLLISVVSCAPQEGLGGDGDDAGAGDAGPTINAGQSQGAEISGNAGNIRADQSQGISIKRKGK